MDFDHPSRVELFIHSLCNSLLAPRVHAAFARNLGLSGHEQVLEFGCGGGPMSPYLAEQLPQGRLTCLDTADAWLERARKRCADRGNVEFVSDDIREAGVAKGPYDVIVIHLMLHDVPAGERPPIVEALIDRLAEGGHVHVKEPTKEGHGMPAGEIDALMNAAGLLKTGEERSRSIFMGPLYYGVYTA
ncbi:MAG: methyltransferase domain-containing protein [Armatimonadia bacterium]|nr:methyltransferase domain-containing protein [Armatimonadia bacterium]